VKGTGDVLVKPGGPLVAEVSAWRRFLASQDDAEEARDLRMRLRTGRPLGDEAFVAGLEKARGRSRRRRSPGPPADRKRKRR
jgi:hypothetical protein